MRPDLIVYVVDDEPDICRSLATLLRTENIDARTFTSAEAFLEAIGRLRPGVVVCDVCMLGMSGIAMIEALRHLSRTDPVIIITGHGDVPLAVAALQAGARDFVEKPFDAPTIIKAIRNANPEHLSPSQERIATLSRREREVLGCLVEGMTNKKIGMDLGISPRTVEIYRAKLMDKMEAANLSRLVRMGVEAGICSAEANWN